MRIPLIAAGTALSLATLAFSSPLVEVSLAGDEVTLQRRGNYPVKAKKKVERIAREQAAQQHAQQDSSYDTTDYSLRDPLLIENQGIHQWNQNSEVHGQDAGQGTNQNHQPYGADYARQDVERGNAVDQGKGKQLASGSDNEAVSHHGMNWKILQGGSSSKKTGQGGKGKHSKNRLEDEGRDSMVMDEDLQRHLTKEELQERFGSEAALRNTYGPRVFDVLLETRVGSGTAGPNRRHIGGRPIRASGGPRRLTRQGKIRFSPEDHVLRKEHHHGKSSPEDSS